MAHCTLCNPREGSPPGSPVPGILQARVVEWAAIAFSTNDVYCLTNTILPSSWGYFPSRTTMKIRNRKICAWLLWYVLSQRDGPHRTNSFKYKYFLVTFHTYFFKRLLYKKLLGLTSRWTIPNWWMRFKALNRLNIYSRTSWKEREFKMS